IWLNDVESACLEPGFVCLAPCEDFTACDGHARPPAQLRVIAHGIGLERFLKPSDVTSGEHFRCPNRPRQAIRPERIAPSCVDHQSTFGPDRLSRSLDNRFIELVTPLPKRSPANLES